MIVVFSAGAEANLEAIGDFIALENPLRAATFVEELTDRCRRLADAPQGYPLVARHEGSGIRSCSHGRYLIFYRVGTERIDVLHILHGARDYERVLFPFE